MTAPTGGRWVFSPVSGFSGVILGINNSLVPVFPAPQFGDYNIEVFTNPAVDTVVGSGFQASIFDFGATLSNNFLTGTDIRLAAGAYMLLDSVTGSASQSGSQVRLGTGNQTVIGAGGDTLIGGSGLQILSALAGNETVVGGGGNESIWGGANDSIVSGFGANQQIVVTGPGTTIVAGGGGNATIAAAAQDTITSLASVQNLVIAAGINDVIDLTGNTGTAGVIGASGDTITGGGGTTNIEGAAGGMLIKFGSNFEGFTARIINLSGSAGAVPGNTVTGGTGDLDFNPSAVAGNGDFINLSGNEGAATINAFAFGSTRVASPDTILAGNGPNTVLGGAGDRIGTGDGSVVGGIDQWSHADTVAGSTVGFGSNDTVSSTNYIGTAAVRGTVPGTSSAQVTVGGFNTTSDFIFYQNETAQVTAAIIATSRATTVGTTPSTIITLPDGTVMMLVGVTQAQLTPALFKP